MFVKQLLDFTNQCALVGICVFCRSQMYLDLNTQIFIITYIEGGQSLAHALLYEVVCDAARGMLVENRVHEGNLGSAASRLCLCGTELSKHGRKHALAVRHDQI